MDVLHKRYARLLKSLSMKVLHNEADAEDLLQEVFMEVWDRISSYNPAKGKPLAWIATLTRRRSIDRLRKRATLCRAETRLIEEMEGSSDSWTHVHEDLAQNEVSVQIALAMAALPEAQRHAINLAYHGQMSQREIASKTGTPLGTIKTRLELGLRKMAIFLAGREDLLLTAKSATAVPQISGGLLTSVPAIA